MKKSVIKNISLPIAGLLGLGVITFGAVSFSEHKKDNVNVALAYEGTPLPASGTLSSGTYYLSSDFTVDQQLKITSGNIIVNLNGHTLNGGGRDKGIFHVTGGTLTVNGKDDETGNRGALNNGGGYYPGSGYSYGGALYITAGAATFNDLDITNCQSNWGGAISMSNSAVTLNNCNLSNNMDTNGYGFYGVIRVGDSSAAGTGLTVNGGEMFSNDGAISVGDKAKVTINGTYIHDNEKLGVRVDATEGLTISGNTIIKDNNTSPRNLVLNNNTVKVGIVSELGNDAYIGVTISGDTKGVFTNSTDTSLNDASKFFSDDSGYAVGKNDDGQLFLVAVRTVTYSTEYGTAPDPVKVATGSTIPSEPIAPTAEGYVFSGWYKESTFENAWDFATDTVDSDITLYAKWLAHTHSFTYSALGNTITATCANTDGNCPFPEGKATLTITGPSGSSIYDGNPKEAEVTDTSNGVAFSNIEIAYYKQNDPSFTGLPIDAGTYVALVSFSESSLRASIQYDVLKAESSVDTAPTANTLTYNESAQELVTAGTVSGGTMVYSLDGTNYSESIPSATDAGEYTVYYKVAGDSNHNDSAIGSITATIEKANVTLTAPTAKDKVWDSTSSELITAGSVTGGELQYKVGDGEWSTTIPSATDVGTYDVYYKVIGDANHKDVEPTLIQVNITTAVATVFDGSTLTYYDSFASAVSNWTSTNGSTLTLLKDTLYGNTITINNDAVLDLNGFGIRMSNTNTRLFYINSSKTLTVNDSNSEHAHAITLSGWRGTSVTDGTGTTSVNDGSGTAYITGGYITGGYLTSNSIKEGAAFFADGGTLNLNGGTIIGNYVNATNCSGAGVYMRNGAHLIMRDGASFIYNYAQNSAAAIESASSYVEIYGGVIAHNKDDWGGAPAISASGTSSVKLYGGTIEDNVSSGSAAVSLARWDSQPTQYFGISGAPVVQNNVSSSGSNANITLYTKVHIEGPLTNTKKIGINLSGNGANNIWNNGTGCFTIGWSTYMAGKDPRDYFFSDNPNYIIGLNADGEVVLNSPTTVTYNTEHGSAPTSATVASGSIISEPTSPAAEGYEFLGWHKDSEFTNAWIFATDTVTTNTTLYAKWDYDAATGNVIKLINDIGDLTYDGGVDDSQEDIIAAKAAYDALTPGQKAVVDGVNKDTLDHDIVVYNHVDNVGGLIKAIPEPSDSQEYYDAVDAAKAAYDALTDEEKAILNADLNFNYKKTLEDNVAAKEVIELIDGIDDVTYNGGHNDSKDDIEGAENAYNNLTDVQKELVDNANKDDLDDAKETYDNVDEAVNLINSIGDVSHGGTSDSQEAIEAARKSYDSLTDEQKALVDSYNNSGKTLKDDEAVYGAMEAIDAIGDVGYDSNSEEAIAHAIEVYDSLTDDQKTQLGEDYVKILTDARSKYSSLGQKGDILFIILIIVTSLTLIGGLVFLYFLIKKKKNKDDDDQNNENLKKGQPAKVYSVGGLFPLVVLVSHYLDTKYIILYVVAGLAVLVWISCLVLVLAKKKAEAAEQVKDDVKVEENVLPQNEDEEEVVTVTDEKGNIFQIRFIKSFTAKLIQSPEETKKYYEELKNEVLSYKKTNTRVSWHYDSINSGRNQVLKFAVRGKTLCVYFPLNADDYADSKYKVEKVESKKFEDVPCLYRIKNDRRLGYAKELIAVVANKLDLEKGEEQHESYANLPYEPNKPLIARGLIKELKVQVNRPSEPEVLESKTNVEGDEIVVAKDASGNIFEIRYIKSFTAKLSQSSDEVKDYYTELKNYALSYKKANSRVSWHYDSVNVGRNQVLKFSIRGKTLCLYYALDAEEYADSKYKVEKVESKKFEDVPCLYRIKNDRRRDYAKELIDVVMEKVGAVKGEESNEDYHIPYEETKVLLGKGLIKEVKTKVNNPEPKPAEVH